MGNDLITTDSDGRTDLAVDPESRALMDEEHLEMPDLSIFDDMSKLQARLKKLFQTYIANPKFRSAVKKHADYGSRLDINCKVAGPMFDRNGEFTGFSMTMDEFRTWAIFQNTGSNLTNMIAHLRDSVNDIVEIMDGTNKSIATPPSLEKILLSCDYENTQMMQIIRYLRILPVYKKMLDALIEIRDRRHLVNQQIDELINKEFSDEGLTADEKQRIKDLNSSVKGSAVDELADHMSNARYLSFDDQAGG